MRSRLLLSTPLVLLAAVALAAALPRGGDDDAEPYALGAKVDPKAIAFVNLDGERMTLADFLPKDPLPNEEEEEAEERRPAPIVVLDFWSIQCPVSVGYESRFKELYQAYAAGEDADVLLLAIDANHTEVDADAADPYARIRAYMEQEEIPFRVLVDRGNVVADRFGAKTTPHVFVLDREQHLRYGGALDDDPNGKREPEERTHYVEDAIGALRAGEEVKVPKTKERGCSIKRAPRKDRGE